MKTQDKLSGVLSDFARTLVTDFPIQGILDHLVRRIVDILPVDAAGVSLISPTADARVISGSDESAVRYENLQTELGEGPCLAACETDGSISIPDLAHDDRFPRFAVGARDVGLAAVFVFPLRNEKRCLGALAVYRESPGALSPRDMATAQILADVAAAYLLSSEARRSKSEFVDTVSHELRTPMTNIAGYVELLQDADTGALNSDQVQFLDAISRNSQRLTALTDELSTVWSLESAGRQHRRVAVDVGAVTSAAQVSLGPAIAARDLDVAFEIPEDPVVVLGDAASLEAVVTNLVTNALKFTGSGGWVRCTLDTTPDAARITVSDNGLGIPRAEQHDLFTRFFRSSTAREHAIQGTGLGLSIVQAIVHNHGGDIAVVSEHLAGATFAVHLPLTTQGPRPIPAQRARDGG